MKLNLGCGNEKIDGYINYDKDDIDLNKKLTFKDNSVDEIRVFHVLEHLINPYDTLMEFYRILKVNGILLIKLPQFASLLPHLRFFHSRHYFNCLTKDMVSNCFQHKKIFNEVEFKYIFVGFKADFPFIKFDLYWKLKKK